MKLFKGLRFKIIVPPFLMFLIIIIMALLFGNYFFKAALNQRILSRLTVENNRFQKKLQDDFRQLSNLGVLVASMKSVESSFERCQALEDNGDSCFAIFTNNFNKLNELVDADMAFYLPSGKLLHITKDVLVLSGNVERLFHQVINTGVSLKYLGDFSGGIRMTSLHPVVDNQRHIIGVVIISKLLKKWALDYYLPKGEGLVLQTAGQDIFHSASIGNLEIDNLSFAGKQKIATQGKYKIIKKRIYNLYKEPSFLCPMFRGNKLF